MNRDSVPRGNGAESSWERALSETTLPVELQDSNLTAKRDAPFVLVAMGRPGLAFDLAVLPRWADRRCGKKAP